MTKVDSLNTALNTKILPLVSIPESNDKIEVFTNNTIKTNVDEVSLTQSSNINSEEKKWLIKAGIIAGALAVGGTAIYFFKKMPKFLKPQQNLPQNYSLEKSQETMDATLKKYLECYAPPKNKTSQQFESKIKNKIQNFYIQEAKKAEEILLKNKDVFEKLDNNYRESIDKVVLEIKSKQMPEQDAYNYLIAEKVKIDQEFGNNLLNILTKEYGFKDVKPSLRCQEKISEQVAGGWNAIKGEIILGSNFNSSTASLVKTIFHEFTHFRQDVELLKEVGELGFIKCLAARLALKQTKENPYKNSKLTTQIIIAAIKANPMYKKLIENFKSQKTNNNNFNKNLIRIRMLENIHYKSCGNSSIKEYLNQLGEIHAHHNGNYFRDLYKSLIPNYTDLKAF